MLKHFIFYFERPFLVFGLNSFSMAMYEGKVRFLKTYIYILWKVKLEFNFLICQSVGGNLIIKGTSDQIR